MNMNRKIALVTGGSRGIGAAIALELADADTYVIINYTKNREAAEDVRKRIESLGHTAEICPANIGEYDEIQCMFDLVEQKHGPVDILVNNAGVEIRYPSTEYDTETYDRIMNVNLKGAFFCSQRALRTMKERRWGRIVNISSVHQDRPTGNRSVYSMSKAGLNMMTREHALEFGGFGITVNTVVPGAILTDMNRGVLADPAYEAKVLQMIPAGYIAEPADVAKTVAFLVSDDSRYVNGATFHVDGGLSLK